MPEATAPSAPQTRWDSATGHGGDLYAAEKAHEAKSAAMLQFARENSARHPPKRRESLVRPLASGGGRRDGRSRLAEAEQGRGKPPPPTPGGSTLNRATPSVPDSPRGAIPARGPRRQIRTPEG